MDWSSEFADRIRENVPLAERTWFKLGGPARYLFSPADVGELRCVLGPAQQASMEVAVLGGGANLLVCDDGFDGLVIRLDEPAFTSVRYDGERVAVGAGADLMELSRDCSCRGLSGLEGLAGIPGTVGGAVAMNAGGRFGQFGDVVETVELIERSGRRCVLSAAEMEFAYRTSAVGDRIVIGAVLHLKRQDPGLVNRKFREVWELKKNSQPLAAHSAGCIFKNPPGESAGRLIDLAGMKGATCGRARVSEMHGNFIVADEGATAGDVLALLEQVRQTVQARTGVTLELEINVWQTTDAGAERYVSNG